MKPRKVGTADCFWIRCQSCCNKDSLFICRPVFNLTWPEKCIILNLETRIFRQMGSKMFNFKCSLRGLSQMRRVNWKPLNTLVLIPPFDALAQWQINVFQAVSRYNHISLSISFNILLFTLRCEQLWGSPTCFMTEYVTIPWGHAVSFHCDGASWSWRAEDLLWMWSLVSTISTSFRKL